MAFRWPKSSKYSIKNTPWDKEYKIYCKGDLQIEDLPYPVEDEDALSYAQQEHGVMLDIDEWKQVEVTVDPGQFLFLRSPFLFRSLPAPSSPSLEPPPVPVPAIAPAPVTPEHRPLVLSRVPSIKRRRV